MRYNVVEFELRELIASASDWSNLKCGTFTPPSQALQRNSVNIPLSSAFGSLEGESFIEPSCTLNCSLSHGQVNQPRY